MTCTKCGRELPDGANFCGGCGNSVTRTGEEIARKPVTKLMQEQVTRVKENISMQKEDEADFMEPSAYNKVFVEPDEQLLGTLGNGYAENILHKKVKKCRALLTNKRVYFQGTLFSGKGKGLLQQKCEKIVDVEDITGTGFLYSKPIGILSAILISIVLGAVGAPIGYLADDVIAILGAGIGVVLGVIINIVRYFINRKTMFVLEYAGGSICFNASIIGIADVKDFQKQIRRAKDSSKKANR